MNTLLRVTSEVSRPLNVEHSVKRSYQSQSHKRRVGLAYTVLVNCYDRPASCLPHFAVSRFLWVGLGLGVTVRIRVSLKIRG